MTQQHGSPGTGQNVLIGALLAAAGVFGLLWAAGVVAALVSGHPVPHRHPVGAFAVFAHPGDPSQTWHAPVGPPVVYWGTLAVLVAVLAALVLVGWRAWRVLAVREKADPRKIVGLASRREVVVAAGEKALLRKAFTLRPGLANPVPADLGYVLGSSRGVTCWASVEDSMVLLGPPRSGKGLHVVISMILDAPGAVITTSTRPDNLAVTLRARAKLGPVAVFDPQHLAPGVPSATRWSPIRGCENPQTAMTRARALTADPADGVENASFWAQQCYTAVRCLLHAAALGHRQPIELFHWSLSPIAASDAVDILRSNPAAAPAWAAALDAILSADPRTRDSTWAMVANTFAALADPDVLDAVSPADGQHFDPTGFLHTRATLYLLGTATGASATAGIVAAFIEDVAEAARRMAASSPGARLDPPLALLLDEGANYPIPSLPALMSEGGGTGITTMVVLQSLAQARSKWGQQDAEAIWDSAIVKIVLGGSGNADDLRDLSALIGTREDKQLNTSWGYDGKQSFSMSTHDKPILEPGQLQHPALRSRRAAVALRPADHHEPAPMDEPQRRSNLDERAQRTRGNGPCGQRHRAARDDQPPRRPMIGMRAPRRDSRWSIGRELRADRYAGSGASLGWFRRRERWHADQVVLIGTELLRGCDGCVDRRAHDRGSARAPHDLLPLSRRRRHALHEMGRRLPDMAAAARSEKCRRRQCRRLRCNLANIAQDQKDRKGMTIDNDTAGATGLTARPESRVVTALTELNARLSAETGDFDEFDGPIYWPTREPERAEWDWPSLAQWVERLRARFPHMTARIPGCWYLHNDLVEALLALRDHERASYASTAPGSAAVEWHRAFRDMEARWDSWIKRYTCTVPGKAHPSALDPSTPQGFAEHVGADLARRQAADDDLGAQQQVQAVSCEPGTPSDR